MTATTTEPRYFPLPATPTYVRRRFGWYAGAGDHGDSRLGTLRVILDTALKPRDSTEVAEYGVRELPTVGDNRTFEVVKDSDDEPATYRCVINPKFAACSCKAGKTGNSCRHRDALAMLIREKVL